MKKKTKPKIGGYRLGKEIGRGGMSVVYSATNEKLKSSHAIKVFDVPGQKRVRPFRIFQRIFIRPACRP